MMRPEEGTLAALKAHRRELIDPLLNQHHGRIFKTTGDGLLIEFASVIDAVRCAVVIQQKKKIVTPASTKDDAFRFASASTSGT